MIAQIGMALGGVLLALLVIIPRNLTPVLASAATHPAQTLTAAFAPHAAAAASDQQLTQPAAPPADARERVAVDLLRGMGNDHPSAEMVALMVEWTIAEDGGGGAISRNNPLNTTMCGYNSTGAINGDGACGVQGYATYQDGIDATLATLNQANFASVAAALRQNDAVAAKQAIWDSRWAASHYNGGADWPHVEPREAAPTAVGAADTAFASAPIAAGGDDCGTNVRVALDASGGALRHVTIPPGAIWSFNAAMGDPSAIPYRTCAGVPGGSWCNLAARYAQVARHFDAQLDFIDHGADLGAGAENSVTIWNVGGRAGFANGSQDLLITNTRSTPLHFGIQADGDQVAIVGWEG